LKINKRAKNESGKTKKLGKKQNKIYQKWQIRIHNMIIEKIEKHKKIFFA